MIPTHDHTPRAAAQVDPPPPAPCPVTGYRNATLTKPNFDAPTDPAAAEAFIRRCYAELDRVGDVPKRLAAVRSEIAATGTYVHTGPELQHGARMAWRNSPRCIGRLYWSSLRVLDRRDSHDPQRIRADLIGHLHEATGAGHRRGQIRPVISIFGPARPGESFHRLWNDQLIRYAGYREGDRIIGDPRYVTLTEKAEKLGWTGERTAFDVLPVVLQSGTAPPTILDVPRSAVLEVPLAHPEHPWFTELGLRWHAVPAVSNMRLEIGGIHYPMAVFNGWYMGTEIGARNLADPDRYNLLPVVAEQLGLDMGGEETLWRDRALVELVRAVQWSFQRSGVRIANHHEESQRFLTHLGREHQKGRTVPTDWTWIVPPMSGAATGVFHRYYAEADLKPNFYLDATAARLAYDPTAGLE